MLGDRGCPGSLGAAPPVLRDALAPVGRKAVWLGSAGVMWGQEAQRQDGWKEGLLQMAQTWGGAVERRLRRRQRCTMGRARRCMLLQKHRELPEGMWVACQSTAGLSWW